MTRSNISQASPLTGQNLDRVPHRGPRIASLAVAVLLALEMSELRAESHTLNAAQIVSLREEAVRFEHGEGVPKDSARAIALYCKGARHGDPESQFSLGWIYANGRGVVRDDRLASLFFQLAAKQGHEHAQNMLRFVGTAIADLPDCLVEKRLAQTPLPPEPPKVDPAPDPTLPFIPVTAAQKQAVALVNELAPQFGIVPRLALAVIRAESNFDPLARSAKNAQGLMQLIPDTSARFSVSKPFDPADNVRGGLAYLRWLLAYFEGDVALVAAAYNAGEGAVNRYRGLPPYPETRAYVKRIVDFFGHKEHPYDRNATEPSPELPRIRNTLASARSKP